MSTCPAGHESAADDYCDVCGLPIEEAGQGGAPTPAEPEPTPEPAPQPEPETETCPNCQAASPPDALFCEACGYDFTTGTAPRSMESLLDLDAPAAVEEPVTGVETPPEPPAEPAAPPPSVAPPLEEAWVAEIWIDPDWYTVQDSSDPLPSAGVPTVVALTAGSSLVGRTSRSRNIHPDIDLSTDNGISRRHCQLTTDGTRWWVEDLGSSNGTFVGSSVGELPDTPLAPGEKREIAADEYVYLGAWTRVVVRRAQPGEV